MWRSVALFVMGLTVCWSITVIAWPEDEADREASAGEAIEDDGLKAAGHRIKSHYAPLYPTPFRVGTDREEPDGTESVPGAEETGYRLRLTFASQDPDEETVEPGTESVDRVEFAADPGDFDDTQESVVEAEPRTQVIDLTESVADGITYQELMELPSIESFFFGSPETICLPDDRRQVTNTAPLPHRASCFLIITITPGVRARGTGFLLTDKLVVTAGHCVHGGWGEGYFHSVEVVPGAKGGQRPYGAQVIRKQSLRASRAWRHQGSIPGDYGAILLPEAFRDAGGKRIGHYGLRSTADDQALQGKQVTITGYPGDRPTGTQWMGIDPITNVSATRLFYMIDTYGGNSGSPVYFMKGTSPLVVGIHNYGGCPNKSTRITPAVIADLITWKNETE